MNSPRSLAAAVALGLLFYFFWPLRILNFFISVIPMHELGHAFTAWMGGRFAFPAGALVPSAGMTLIGESRQLWVTICFLGVLGFLSYRAWLEDLYFLFTSFMLLILGTAYLHSIANVQLSAIISYGGIAGEIIISSWMILASSSRSFELLRWDFFRHFALGWGSLCLTHATLQWFKIKAHLEPLPMGSAVSSDGAGDASGDLNRLILGGWSESQIISRYLFLVKLGLALIVLQYIYQHYFSDSASTGTGPAEDAT